MFIETTARTKEKSEAKQKTSTAQVPHDVVKRLNQPTKQKLRLKQQY